MKRLANLVRANAVLRYHQATSPEYGVRLTGEYPVLEGWQKGRR